MKIGSPEAFMNSVQNIATIAKFSFGAQYNHGVHKFGKIV